MRNMILCGSHAGIETGGKDMNRIVSNALGIAAALGVSGLMFAMALV